MSTPCTWSPAPTTLSSTPCTLAALPVTQMPPLTVLLPARSRPETMRAVFGFAIAFSSPRKGPANLLPSMNVFSALERFLPLRPFSLARALKAPGSNESTAPPPAPLSASLRLPPCASVVMPPVSAPMPILASGPILRKGSAPVSAPPAAPARTLFQFLPSLMAWMAPMPPPMIAFTIRPPGMKLAASESPVTSSCPAGLCRKFEVAL